MSPSIEDIRRRVAKPMRDRGVVRASIFGSVARGNATDSSDVDFLVEFEQGRSLLDLAGLKIDLAHVLSCKVDVATPSSLHPALKEHILSDLISIL